MSFKRETVASTAQNAIYEVLRAAVLTVWFIWMQPFLSGKAAEMNVPGAVAWGSLVSIVIMAVAVFALSWWRARSKSEERPQTLPPAPVSPGQDVEAGAKLFPPSVSQSPSPPAIFVGRIHPTVQHLADEHWFELSITVFNGTGREFIIDKTPRGRLIVSEQAMVIPAAIVGEIPPFDGRRRTAMRLRQHLKPEQAAAMKAAIDSGEKVPIMLDGMQIVGTLKLPDRTTKEIGLPLPDGITVGNGVTYGEIIVAQIPPARLTFSGTLGSGSA